MFEAFPKVPRWNRELIITEKLDGTNAQVAVFDKYELAVPDRSLLVAEVDGFVLYAGSRRRYVIPGKTTDNFGFAQWVKDNAEELVELGPGRHYGEWWGRGIQRGYEQQEQHFSLFNVGRWDKDTSPRCCKVVPTLRRISHPGLEAVENVLDDLRRDGSRAAPGYMNPEGVVIYHTASGQIYKMTCKDDDKPKSLVRAKRSPA